MKSSSSKANKAVGTAQGHGAEPSSVPIAGDLQDGVEIGDASVSPSGALLGPAATPTAADTPTGGSPMAPADTGGRRRTESLDDRDQRRMQELTRQMKMVRARRQNRRVASQRAIIKKSTRGMTSYLGSLPADAKFTIDVLVRFGAKAEELGLDPADLFAKLDEIARMKQK